MVTLVFVIGTLNIALGFALALGLERGLVLYVPTWGAGSVPPDATRGLVAARAEEDAPPGQKPDGEGEEEPPGAARAPGAAAGESAQAEESLGALQRDVHRHIDTLLHLEDQIRGALDDPQPAAVHTCAEQLVAAGEEWLARQCAMVRTMADTREQWGPHADVERRLERMLLDQTPALESSGRALATLDPTDDVDAVARLLQDVIQRLRDAHQLRDGVQEALASLALREARAEPLNLSAHVDPLTRLPNGVGLALLCRAWSRAAADSHPRPLALLDLDDFGRANQLLGTRAADELLQAVAELLQREFEHGEARIGRFSGQQYLVLWRRGEPQEVSQQLERLLTFVSETPFSCAGQAYRLSARGGLTLLRPQDDIAGAFRLLNGLTELARHAGPRRLALDLHEDPHITTHAAHAPVADVPPNPAPFAGR